MIVRIRYLDNATGKFYIEEFLTVSDIIFSQFTGECTLFFNDGGTQDLKISSLYDIKKGVFDETEKTKKEH